MRCWGAAPDILLPASIRTVQNQGMERFDTVVIGAGIAGLTAARLLVAAGAHSSGSCQQATFAGHVF